MNNIHRTKVQLSGVNETMLIPLYARSIESKKKKPAFNDTKATEITKMLDYDFTKFKNGKMSQWGVAARTIILDRETKKYIKKHPNCICINIGCGLDTRFFRVDNNNINWYDLDLSPVVKLRKQLIPEHERVTLIEGSATDNKWTELIEKNRHTLIILEGILMYFSEEEIKELFQMLSNMFPNCTILAEISTDFLIKNQKLHDTVSKTSAVFKWGIRNSKDLEQICPSFKFLNEWNLTQEMKRFSPVFITLISPMLRKRNNRIAKFVNKY